MPAPLSVGDDLLDALRAGVLSEEDGELYRYEGGYFLVAREDCPRLLDFAETVEVEAFTLDQLREAGEVVHVKGR